MKKWVKLAAVEIPNDGGTLSLARRDAEFSIRLSGIRGELMNSRVHGSEEALAALGCRGLETVADARVLVGGMGMGFTLAAALAAVPASARVTVVELIPEVIEWNKGPLGDCAGRPLDDSRTRVQVGDVAEFINGTQDAFDAILLDVDNGPEGLTHSDNQWLYSAAGLRAIWRSLGAEGTLAVWSAGPDPQFVIRLRKAGFHTSVRSVRARPGKGSHHTIFLGKKGSVF